MPKVSSKSKYGWKAGANEQLVPNPGDSVPKTSQGCGPSSKVSGGKDFHLHHKSSKHSSALLRDDRRRDKALKKLCDKATGHPSVSAAPMDGVCPSGSETTRAGTKAVTPDQVSLQDCPVTILTSDLWGSATVPAPLVVPDSMPTSNLGPAPSSSSVQAPIGVVPAQDHVCILLSPAHSTYD